MLRGVGGKKLMAMLGVVVAGTGVALAAVAPADASTSAVAGTGMAAGTSADVTGLPAVEDCGTGAALTRPHSLILTCADSGMTASDLHWRSWNATEAVATATVTWLPSPAVATPDRTSANVTLTGPVTETGGMVLFTSLNLRVTGATPSGFKRTVTFSEAPVQPVSTLPAQLGPRVLPSGTPTSAAASGTSASPAAAAASGTLDTASIGGYWELAGGPSSVAETAEAITGAEASFEPGIIQPDEGYSTTGWGLWQITPGDSVPAYGEDFQLLDPWNNAEAAVYKYDAAGGFTPWTTYVDGAYEGFTQYESAPDTNLSDPGQYVPVNSAPSGTNNSSDPGSTYGPVIPGGSAPASPQFAFKAVFQDNDTDLAGLSNAGSDFTTTLGMMAGTSPSVTTLSDGTFEAAFEANNDYLAFSHLGGGTLDTHEGMLQGTSPAIAALPGGAWIAAFQANNNHLVLFDSSQHVTDTGLGMYPGTSPAIAVQSDGSYKVVFQANNNLLAGYESSGSNFTTTAGMEPGTSPSIAVLPDDEYEVAVQASTGELSTLHFGDGYSVNNTSLGMDTASSPAIAAQSDGSFRVVFEANNNLLAGYESTGSNFTATTGMKAGTSPSITAEPSGEYEVAIEANTDKLSTLHFGDGYTVDNTDLGMDDVTSPAITY